ncbi:MAG: hypothetical protein GY854_29745, partial [Deltaproteobacteria bacterium]|nr:hypothetical protein [Deltaproteobacteria bacterium]
MGTRKSSYDTEAIAKYFIEQTPPDMRLREFSDLTASLACTGYRHVGRDFISELAKDGQWRRKRAEFFAEQNPDVYETTIKVHEILTRKLFEDWEDMKGGELASLARQQGEFALRVMRYRPADAGAETPFIDSDRAKEIVRQEVGRQD